MSGLLSEAMHTASHEAMQMNDNASFLIVCNLIHYELHAPC